MTDTDRDRAPYRGSGWWLPAPSDRYGADNGPERDARFRFIGVWIIRLWLVICASFGGLLWSNPHTTKPEAFFGTGVFVGGTGLLLVGGMSLAWFLS